MSRRKRKRHLDHSRKLWTFRWPKWPFYARAWLTVGDVMRLKRDPWMVYQR